MSEQLLAELEELSVRATPGPWRHIVGDDYAIESDSYPRKPTHSPCVMDSGWWLAIGNRPDDFGEANSKFIVVLVNAYRSGQLARASDAEHYMRLASERSEDARSWRAVAERLETEIQELLHACDSEIRDQTNNRTASDKQSAAYAEGALRVAEGIARRIREKASAR
jgi:hypothetical protein